jgi:hypothetical protein
MQTDPSETFQCLVLLNIFALGLFSVLGFTLCLSLKLKLLKCEVNDINFFKNLGLG